MTKNFMSYFGTVMEISPFLCVSYASCSPNFSNIFFPFYTLPSRLQKTQVDFQRCSTHQGLRGEQLHKQYRLDYSLALFRGPSTDRALHTSERNSG